MPSAIRTPNGGTRPRQRVIEPGPRALVVPPRRRSWRQAPKGPPVARARPDEPVVKPRFAPLPELEVVRLDAHAAPVRRPRHVRGKARGGVGERGLEPLPIRDRHTLRGRPCADARRT